MKEKSGGYRPKIIFVIDTLETGGAEKSIYEISSRLQKLQPVVVHPYPGNTLKYLFVKAGIPVYSLGLTGKYKFLKGVLSFRRFLQKEEPALVIATLMRSEIIARWACRLEQIPLLSTFVNDTYSPYEYENLSLVRKLKKETFRLLDRWTAPLATHFLANAASIKYSNAEALGIAPDDISVIYRGRSTAPYSVERTEPNNGRMLFVNVGRLIPRKGQEELIRAFARFQQSYPESLLKIAGAGKNRPVLEALIDTLGVREKVKLLGNVKDIPALLHNATCFVFPSHYEGFSGALIEAMLAGLPILASDIPMNREALSHGKTGRLFAVKDEQAILDAMLWFAENRETGVRMGKRANLEARMRFDIEKITREHENLYLKIIEQTRK